MTITERLSNLETFESERLFFRHATEEDAADMCELFHDSEVAKWIHVPMPASVAETLEFSIKRFHLANPLGKHVMVDKASGKMISSIDIRPDEKNHAAETGYALNRAYWGRGFMTEALKTVIEVSFKELGIHRLESFHAPENLGSGRVMQKAGMKYEGTLRDHELLPNGTYVDSKMYAILSTDMQLA